MYLPALKLLKYLNFVGPISEGPSIFVPLNFFKVLSFPYIYLPYETFMYLAQNFEFWRARLGETPIVSPAIFVRLSLFKISTHPENLIHLALTA